MQQFELAPQDRLVVVDVPVMEAARSFAEEVRAGLTGERKTLPSKFLYDDLGSALFDAITRLPEYYLTACETEILHDCGWEMVRMLGGSVEFLELGSGSAQKTRVLIEEALRVQDKLRYSPIDISADALRSSSSTLADRYDRLYIRGYAGDYFTVLQSDALQFEDRVLAMLMGSNIGNYAPSDARALIDLTSKALRPGDGLLLGVDRKKDLATLENAYDDPAGVTAAFDKNILGRINRELRGAFDLRAFRHVARYDEERGCIESFLEATSAQRVPIGALDVTIEFERGERIHTESSYKFDDADIDRLIAGSKFARVRRWSDARERFSVYLLVRS